MAIPFSHRSQRPLATLLFALICLVLSVPAAAKEILAVHEWGTFTALQNESGDALPGINIDDEPLPAFCHNLHPWALVRANATRPVVDMKGVPQRHPWVTLRLETPVLYFHPAKQSESFPIDVSVRFRGGWLTEFYPQADPDEPGLKRNQFNFGPITPETVGSLSWHDVEVGSGRHGPQTDEHVWLAPRNVRSAFVTVPPQTDRDRQSESEQFLFYRGVGNRPVPLRVSTDASRHRLDIRGQCADVIESGQSLSIRAMWLVHIRSDGSVAYRTLDPIKVTADTDSVLATTNSEFADSDYSIEHMGDLRSQVRAALTADGLNDDEATAMLETWKRAYFRAPGLRLFFLVPRSWTDAVLPLTLSRDAKVNRVMMGRIELISPEQRRLLAELSTAGTIDPSWLDRLGDTPAARRFREGRSNFGDPGVPIPRHYQTYLDLGRFRNALVLAEQRAHPTPGLTQFINAYGLYVDRPE